jgi:hypothetical protein
MFNYSNSKAIVPTKGAAVANVSSSAAIAVIKAGSVPPAIRQESAKLLVAFPVVGMVAEEKKALLDLYGRAVDGYEEPIIMEALDWLIWNNPRHTEKFSTHPAPADLRDACKMIRAVWSKRIEGHFLGHHRYGAPWNGWGFNYSASAPKWGGEPFTDDCPIPPALVMKLLREATCSSRTEIHLVEMPQEKFDAIPCAGFKDGVRDKLIAAREKYAEQRAEEERKRQESLAKFEAEWKAKEDRERVEAEFLTTLSPELRRACEEVMREQRRYRPDACMPEAVWLRMGQERLAAKRANLDCERLLFKRLEEEALEESRRHAEGSSGNEEREGADT